MKKKTALIVLLCVLCMLVSCRHTQTVVEEEPIDLTPSMDLLFDSRPDNTKLDIIVEVQTLDDIILNSAEYLKAWEWWENYSDALEEYIRNIGKTLRSSD